MSLKKTSSDLAPLITAPCPTAALASLSAATTLFLEDAWHLGELFLQCWSFLHLEYNLQDEDLSSFFFI